LAASRGKEFAPTGQHDLGLVEDIVGAEEDAPARGGFPVQGVPEPSVWALMIGGLGLAGTQLRRRRAAAA
jgi:hypothetical protein